jgi:hypothetical protein
LSGRGDGLDDHPAEGCRGAATENNGDEDVLIVLSVVDGCRPEEEMWAMGGLQREIVRRGRWEINASIWKLHEPESPTSILAFD